MRLYFTALCVLASLSGFAQIAQEAVPPSIVCNLQYVESGLYLRNTSLQGDKEVAFKKEPALSEDAARGMMSLGNSDADYIGFAWDTKSGKLYIDKNRNLDLTDDPENVYESTAPDMGALTAWAGLNMAAFKNIRMELLCGGTSVPYVFSMESYGGRYWTTTIESGWQGEVALAGQTYRLRISDNFSGTFDSKDSFVLDSPDDDTDLENGDFPAPNTLAIGGKVYELAYEFAAGAPPGLRITFTETTSELDAVKWTGKYIDRVLMYEDDDIVLVYRPGAETPLPVSDYSVNRVELTGGFYCSPNTSFLGVRAGEPVEFKEGGPLTQKLGMTRFGRQLTFSYKLVGAGGGEYSGASRENPPKVLVFRDGTQIASGSFEYG
jgi:hypothetical protein